MDLTTQFALASMVLIGLVNWVAFAIDQQWKSFALCTAAVVAGTAFGYLGWFTIPSIEMGFAFGIASSGVYKVTQKLGGQ